MALTITKSKLSKKPICIIINEDSSYKMALPSHRVAGWYYFPRWGWFYPRHRVHGSPPIFIFYTKHYMSIDARALHTLKLLQKAFHRGDLAKLQDTDNLENVIKQIKTFEQKLNIKFGNPESPELDTREGSCINIADSDLVYAFNWVQGNKDPRIVHALVQTVWSKAIAKFTKRVPLGGISFPMILLILIIPIIGILGWLVSSGQIEIPFKFTPPGLVRP